MVAFFPVLALALIALAQAGSPGVIEGTLTVKNLSVPAARTIDGREDTMAVALAKNALLYVRGYKDEAPRKRAVMNQIGKTFDPVVLPVIAGQWVEFVNGEPTPLYHHVFSPSDAVKRFDLGKFKPPQKREQLFTKEGRVDVFCDIHKEMKATVYVVPNGQYTVLSSADQPRAPFRIEGVRPGRWTLVAWHAGAEKPVEVPVEVEPGASTKVDVVIEMGTGLDRLLSHKNRLGKAYTDEQRQQETGW